MRNSSIGFFAGCALCIVAALVPVFAAAQSKTTDKLQKEYEEDFSLFFYHNTLRMINQQEDKEFDEIIKDIEKMKLLILKKEEQEFDFKDIVAQYHKESFEEIMTSRHQGKNFDIFIREDDGKTKAMLVLVNDDENLFILDILGSIALDKVTKLFTVMDESSDIGSKIEQFVKGDEDEDEDDNDEADTEDEKVTKD